MATLDEIAKEQERAVLRAFNAAIASVKETTVINEIVRALEVGNVDAVIELLQLDRATFEPLESAIAEAYRVGGITGAAQVGVIPTVTAAATSGTLVMRFDVRSPAAETWLRQKSSDMIVEVIEPQREMVRRVLTDRLAEGVNPRTAALDLVGRVSATTGKRVGGFIGLTDSQATWIRNARRDLESLDPNYLTRQLRDRRFDAAFKRAIKDGTPLPAGTIDAAVSRMQERALKYRGDTIARTESINALRSGQFEAIIQAAEAGELDRQDVTKIWDSSGDARTRPDHLRMEGQPQPLDQPFIAPDAYKSRMMFPGDSSLGARPEQTIQCRCRARMRMNFGAKIKRIDGFS